MPERDADEATELDIRFEPPESRVISVRLNRAESRELTRAARRAGEPLSTYMKRTAIDAARSEEAAPSTPQMGSSIDGDEFLLVRAARSTGEQTSVPGSAEWSDEEWNRPVSA